MEQRLSIITDKEMQLLGQKFAQLAEDALIIYLIGTLGAGKTTFARGFIRGLGYKDKVKSPTYTIVEPYQVANRQILHFDFYRIHHANELAAIGFDDYFKEPVIALLEWPEKVAPSVLPPPDLTCTIYFAKTGRTVQIVAHSNAGERILTNL